MPTLKKSSQIKIRRINREERNKVYTSYEWKKLRKAKLMQQPLCELCLKLGKITPAVDVHHDRSFTDEQGINYSLAFDINNLISLCKECHSKLHIKGKTQGGLKALLEQKD